MKKLLKWFGIVCISLLVCVACKDSGGEKPKTAPAASTQKSVPATRADMVVSKCNDAAKMLEKDYKQLMEQNYKNLGQILAGARVKCLEAGVRDDNDPGWIWVNVTISKVTAFTDDDFAKAHSIATAGVGALGSIMYQTGWGRWVDMKGTADKPAALARVTFVDKDGNPVFVGYSYLKVNPDRNTTEVWSGNILGRN